MDIFNYKTSYAPQYWIYKYLLIFKKDSYIFENLSFHRKFLLNKEKLLLNKIIKNKKKYTIIYNLSNPAIFLSEKKKKLFKDLFFPKIKVKSKLLYSKHFGKEMYDFLINPNLRYDEKFFKRIIKNFSYNLSNERFKTNKLWALFNVNFLRKERMYTKLKYSRVPQYDMVSGGAAALLAALLGFLITEKFGFELPDSGDFYILFMYLVFFFFFARLFLKLINSEKFSWNILSLKWLFFFYQTLIVLLFNKIKKLIKND